MNREEMNHIMNALEKTNADLRHNLEDWKAENEALKVRIKELEDELQVANRCAYDARERIKELEDVDYINQLRYERLMWKAEAIRNIDIEWLFDNTDLNNSKPLGTVLSQLDEIAEALEARARRIKEDYK